MKFYLHKLGCPKNDVDAEYIAARLIADGHELVVDPEKADSVLVNTCGFIEAAKEESVEELLRLGQLKKSGNLKTLYATGCLSQRYGQELLKDMPELDGAFGLGALDSIADAVTNSKHLDKPIKREARQLGYLTWKDRFLTDNLPYSYLKISDGCDRMCTYCAIPSMRGHFRSRPLDSIIREAEFLASSGKKELILVSQEATMWGYDLPNEPHVISLLEALDRVDGIEWIRLMYLHPAKMDKPLVEYMASNNKTLNYFDMPLQHMSTPILERMRRQINKPQTESVLDMIRSHSENATLRTTFIVGFPGENQEQFEELLDAVETYKFDRLGVFPYSPEEGTPAEQMTDQIDDDTKQERIGLIMSLQQEIAFERNAAMVGQEVQVLIDSVDANGEAVGRTSADCPEIDQEVFVEGRALAVGDLLKVRITASEGYDLRGEVINQD